MRNKEDQLKIMTEEMNIENILKGKLGAFFLKLGKAILNSFYKYFLE